MESEKAKLLRSLRLLDHIPESHLAALEEFLKPLSLKDGALVFDEGSKGSSLYFIASGHIRISKTAGKTMKDLAILSPGDCFGEMAIVADVKRSARATASGPTVVFQLARKDLDRWLKSHAEHAMGFFAGLVQVQSKRLRRTSNELALLFDLSNLLLASLPTSKELLGKVLETVVPHLEGTWSAAANLYNVFNEEMELISQEGDFDFKTVSAQLPPAAETRNLWLGEQTYYVSLPGPQRPHGYLIFRSHLPLMDEDRNETGRTLTTVARLLTSALENINFRNEESLRARLKSRAYGQDI